jgi:hypothetical protein
VWWGVVGCGGVWWGVVGCVVVWGVCGVGEGVSLLRSNIPRSALCATLDTYNFLRSKIAYFRVKCIMDQQFYYASPFSSSTSNV